MEEDESRKDDCEYSCTEQNGCAVEYTGPVEATSVTLVRVTISIKNKANATQRLLRDMPHDPGTILDLPFIFKLFVSASSQKLEKIQ